MKSRLLKGLDERGTEVAKADFSKAIDFRKMLKKALDEDIESLHNSMRDETNFGMPSWPFYQADRVAQVKALKKVISLLE